MNITYERVPVDLLKVEKYNRTIKVNEAKRIAAFYDEKQMGLVVVGNRNGVYTIIDGQHRTMAAKLLGLPDIMCQVFHGLTYEEEAMLFVKLNAVENRKALVSFDRVRGLHEANDQTVTRMHNVAGLMGMKISDQVGDNKLACVQSIYKITKKSGSDMLLTILTVAKEAWGGEKESLRAHILEGIWILLSKHGSSVDSKRLAEKLKKVLPSKILAEADAISDGTKATRVYRRMLKYYNKNLHESSQVREE